MGITDRLRRGKAMAIRRRLSLPESIRGDPLAMFSLFFLLFVLVLAAVGPYITPYEYDDTQYTDDGELKSAVGPSLEHPLGTTLSGYDVLSRAIYGARPTVITGLLGGAVIIGLGSLIGVTSGYFGGRTDGVLMRFTDLVYGIPLIPFALVIIVLFGLDFFGTILVMGVILWRSSARVLRSQVLQIKERPFVRAAKAMGGTHPYIIRKHIVPNILSMGVLFFSLGVGFAILVQAGLAFVGAVSPFVPSWGIMLRNVYDSGLMQLAWWWALTPGLLVSLTVFSTFTFGRKYAGNEQASRGLA